MKEPIEKKLNINPAHLHAYSANLLHARAYQEIYLMINRVLLPHAISNPEWRLLGQLYEHTSLSASALADYLVYDPPLVTKLTKELEKKGLIVRCPNDKDERVKIISITETGKKLIEQVEPIIINNMRQLLLGVTKEELAIFIKVLITIVNNASAKPS